MRRLVSLIFAAALLAAGPVAAQSDWTSYKSAEHGFSADLPAEPAVSGEDVEGAGPTTVVSAQGPGGFFVVTVTRVPVAILNEPNRLDALMTGVVEGAGGQEMSRRSTTVSGEEAREVAFDLPDGLKATGLGVIRGERVYVAMTLRRPEVDPADAARFTRSVRLID